MNNIDTMESDEGIIKDKVMKSNAITKNKAAAGNESATGSISASVTKINSKHSSIEEAVARNTKTGESLRPYIRQAMYYETDQMAVIHHSNYIRWFEESRIDFLEQIGLDYDRLEEEGILIPVLGVSCEYKSSVRFNEKVMILPHIISFNGVKMTIGYQVLDADAHTLKAAGESRHCFVNRDFKPIHMKKDFTEIYDIFLSWVN